MNKLIPLFTFSVLLLIPVGAQNAFGSLINDEVTVEFGTLGQQTGVVVNDLANPEFVYPNIFGIGLDVRINVESEEFWIEYISMNPTSFTGASGFDFWIMDLNWIENGVEIPGIIQDVTCTQMATLPISFGPPTVMNNEIHIPIDSVSIPPLETASIHCNIDVIHENQVVGGKIIPIDSTSLILAGAQSFSWMIPVTLSILGIGLFVVYRKK